MKTFAKDVSPDRTFSIGTGNASASVAATSSISAGPARVVTPSQKAKPTTTAAAAITGATTGHVPAGAAPRTRAIRLRRSPETTTPSAAADMKEASPERGWATSLERVIDRWNE